MEPKFKIGQVWKRRNGEHATISEIELGSAYPVYCTVGYNYTAEGLYIEDDTDGKDLVELISDITDEAPAPTFAVGQVWRRRDDRTIRIDEVEGPEYEGNLVVLGDDGMWRNRQGSVNGSEGEDTFDLVQLLPVTEPSAPAIADAMLADAVGLAPQHDTEAAGEPVPVVELDVDPMAGTVRKKASQQERMLFDALVIRTVDRYGIDALPANLDTIKQVIAARRAL